MKTQLATPRGRQDHPPQPASTVELRPTRRVGLLDRAALHVGIALITWGRRPARRERPALSRETLEARRRMEERNDQHQSWGATLTRMR